MAGDPSAPRRVLVAALAASLAGIGGALLAGAAGWSAWAGFLGAPAGTLAAGALFGRSGEPAPFAPARAADAALARGSTHAASRPEIDLKPAQLPLVAVLPSDLLEALAGTLTRALAQGRLVGPLSVAAENASDALDVRIAWAVEDRYALDPSGALEPLRWLVAYGARADVHASIEDSALEIVLRLPRYVGREERRGEAEIAGGAS